MCTYRGSYLRQPSLNLIYKLLKHFKIKPTTYYTGTIFGSFYRFFRLNKYTSIFVFKKQTRMYNVLRTFLVHLDPAECYIRIKHWLHVCYKKYNTPLDFVDSIRVIYWLRSFENLPFPCNYCQQRKCDGSARDSYWKGECNYRKILLNLFKVTELCLSTVLVCTFWRFCKWVVRLHRTLPTSLNKSWPFNFIRHNDRK